MKKVLLIALTLFFAAPNLQAKGDDEEVKIVLVKEENSDNYYYEGVVPVEGVTKEEMFKRAKAWLLSKYRTDDNNIESNESESSILNTITFKIKESAVFWPALVNCKVDLKFKDGKYKFRFDNILIKMLSPSNIPAEPYGTEKIFSKKFTTHVMNEINLNLPAVAADLENAIKGAGSTKDDW